MNLSSTHFNSFSKLASVSYGFLNRKYPALGK